MRGWVLAALCSRIQEFIRFNSCLFQDGTKRAFGHIARMVGDRGVTVRDGAVPDLVAPSSLAVKLKPKGLQFSSDLTVAKPRKAAQLSRDHNCIFAPRI